MDKINEKDVSREHRKSPQEAFEMHRQHVSVAMRGGETFYTGPWEGGPPFDVEITTIPPGKKNYPYHSHACSWEYYIFISGTGKFRDENNDWHDIKPGDHVQCATNQAHQIWNDGSENLIFYVIAGNCKVEVAHYPDTGKTLILPERKLGYLSEADYYEREE
jgi:uncharacterized cupin superfamily protein